MGQKHHFLWPHALPTQELLEEKHIEWNVLHHIRVLRIKKNERVGFMDGEGLLQEAQCLGVKPYQFKILSSQVQRPLSPHLELCLAPPRQDLSQAIHQATEMGIQSIRFLRSDFTQYASHLEAPTSKAQRIADASCEQCVRAWRCEVLPGWHDLSQCLALPGIHIFSDESLAQTEPEAIGFEGAVPVLEASAEAPIRLYIGSEGGWSERERHIFDGQALPLSLGSLILRVPTAIVAATHFVKTVYAHRPNG